MASTDPIATLFNGLLAALEADTDFQATFLPANQLGDTQEGWLATYLQNAPAQYPAFRFLLGNGKDLGFLYPKGQSFALETNETVEDAECALDQDFIMEFWYDVNFNDSMKQRAVEFVTTRALMRLGPRAGQPGAYLPVGPFITRRFNGPDVNGVMRPMTRITFNVAAEYNVSTIL